MKTKQSLFFVIILGLLVGFSSCKKDDPEDLLIGTWKYSKIEVDISTSDSMFDAMIKEAVTSGFDMGQGATMTFNSNGTYASTHIDEDGTTKTDGGTYKLQGNNLIVMDGKDEMTYQVSKNELRLSQDVTEETKEEMGELEDLLTINKLVITIVCTK